MTATPAHSAPASSPAPDSDEPETIKQPRLWRDNGWTARVIKNEDDEGWAVAMVKDGEPEPALIGPWTMGRDKKNPKPLDTAAFNTLVKTASEVIRRHEQHLQATLHKSVTVRSGGATWQVTLDIMPDDDDPQATLSAFDASGAQVGQCAVRADFKLNTSTAAAWVAAGFSKPA